MTKTWDVAVVGGGLAGLAAAAAASERGATVVLLDRDQRGGRAATDVVGRFHFNRGAHALFRAGAGAAVLARFGVTPKGSTPPTRGRLGRVGDEVAPAFSSKLLGRRGRIEVARTLAGMWRWKPEEVSTMSAGEWLDDLDLSERATNFIETLIRTATYAADPFRISADVALDSLRTAAKGNVLYLDGGWDQLVRALHAALRERNAPTMHGRVTGIEPDGDRVVVTCEDRELVAGHIVLAAGGPAACASLLPERPLSWDHLGPPSRIACLDLGLAAPPRTPLLFGYDRPLYLSQHAPPAALAPEGGSVVHLMRYLRPDEKLSAAEARAELTMHAALAGIDVDAAEERRYLHEMIACSALPVPEFGGLARRPSIRTGIPGVFVAGDWVGPTGHLADAALVSGAAAGDAAAVSVHDRRSKIAA